MPVVAPHRAVEILAQSKDPKKDILATVGDLSGVDVMFNMVLVGVFIRSERTLGGIIRPTANVTEDVWQGKAGLVLKLGPNAFVDDADDSFYGQRVEVGEWCAYKVGDAWQLSINGYPCRLVRDSAIKLKLSDPNIVF